MDLWLKDVRGFEGEHRIPIRPITLFVGENSSGKTTALSMLTAVLEAPFEAGAPSSRAFNTPPVALGNYSSIAKRLRRRTGVSNSFGIGLELGSDDSPSTEQLQVHLQFRPKYDAPLCTYFGFRSKHGTFEMEEDQGKHKKQRRAPKDSLVVSVKKVRHPILTVSDLPEYLGIVFRKVDLPRPFGRLKFSRALNGLARALPKAVYPFGPIRVRPERAYQIVSDVFDPEGDHTPFVLNRVFTAGGVRAKKFQASLSEFGRRSGLFTSVESKRQGSGLAINVTIGGVRRNLADVGYGVSQCLPMIVDALLGPEGAQFILQEPEVHLHPSAQAALATFLVDAHLKDGKRFALETHSDYIIDRIRWEVLQGRLKPRDVAYVYFERKEGRFKTHLIELDANGNLLNPPAGFRKFFMEEERRVFFGERD